MTHWGLIPNPLGRCTPKAHNISFWLQHTPQSGWADNWDSKAVAWLCDRFSKNVYESLSRNPSINYRDLFLYCVDHTLGSHARIVNANHFGNLYVESPEEFIVRK